MRVSVTKDRLLDPLSLAASVVPKKTSRPILLHVLLSVGDDGLTVRATDEEQSVSYLIETVEGAERRNGACAVAARDFRDIVAALKTGPISLALNEEKLEITQDEGRIRFELHTLSAMDFPDLPTWKEERWVRLEPSALVRQIETVSYAVSQDEARYYLGGVYVEEDVGTKGRLCRFVATDGHRLALSQIDEVPAGFPDRKIIPARLIAGLKKFLSGQNEVFVAAQDKRIAFRIEGATLESLFVEGSYPDYRQVIPRTPSITCRVNRQELLFALRRIVLLTPDKTGGCLFRLGGDGLQISSKHTGRGQAKEEIRLLEGGGEIEIGFDAKYWIDALGVLDTEQVELAFTNYLSPCVIRSVVKDETDTTQTLPVPLAVVMPMRL